MGPRTCGSARSSQAVLGGVQPSAQVLFAVEPVDGSVLAARARRAEYLDPEMAREPAGRGDDALEKLLVGGFVTRSDPPGHGRDDGIARQRASVSLSCSSPIEFPSGSTNQAEREADVGDAAGGLQPGLVVFLELHTPGAQVRHLRGKVTHPPGGLGLRLARAGRAAGDDETAVAAAAEGQEVVALDQDLEPDRRRRTPSRRRGRSPGSSGRSGCRPASQVPSASIIRRAAAAPEYCCWPVIRLPSRTACGLKRTLTMKLLLSSLFASSSIQNGWIFFPTKSSA